MANPKFVYCLSAEYMLECQRDEWSDSGLEWWVLDYDVHQGMQRLSRDRPGLPKAGR